MKHKNIATSIAAACIVLALTGCKPNLRDMKMSEMTIGQKEEVVKSLTQAELDVIQEFEVKQTLKAMENAFSEAGKVVTGDKKMSEVKAYNPEDLSINEIIKLSKEKK